MPLVWLDKIIDLLITVGVINVVLGLLMYVAMSLGVVLDKEFAINTIIGGVILSVGSIIIGITYIAVHHFVSYLHERFFK